MKNNKTLPRHLRLRAVLLLLIASALLTIPQDALAQVPRVERIEITSDAGDDNIYITGDTIQVTVDFDNIVQVTGTPQLTLKIGTADRAALYKRNEGNRYLVFEYTVAEGDEDTDGIEIEANQLLGTIRQVVSQVPVDLSHDALSAQDDHKVDGVGPTISSVAITSTASNNYYEIGDTIQTTVTFDDTVTVDTTDGTPRLTLKIGTANRAAAYTSGSGTTALVFQYTVVFGDEDTNGIEIEANKLALNGGTITDTLGNAATLTHTALPTQTSHKVDGLGPAISSISISSGAGADNTYITGDAIQATVTYDELVKVKGTPQLTLKVGTADKTARYKSSRTSNKKNTNLIFEYTVATGDADTDGIEIAANQLSLNGGTINGTAESLPAELKHAALTPQASHKVDGIAPTVSSLSISSNPNNSIYEINDKIQVTVTFSETMNVTGTPQLTLKIGAANRNARYKSGPTSTNLIFEYTIAAGDADADGIEIAANQLSLNGGTIKDVPGNPAILTHAALAMQRNHKVDAAVPTVAPQSVAITSTPTRNHIYKKGETIQATVTFDHAVNVTGTPELTLTIGTADRNAAYTRGSGTTDLVFAYTVGSSDEDTDGIAIAANQLTLSNATLTSVAGYPVTLTHAALTTQQYHRVDGVVPTVSSLAITSSAGADNFYTESDIIQTTVTFTEPVNVTGTPQLTLKIGSKNGTAAYTRGSGTADLVFAYTVVNGDEDIEGIAIYANQLTLPNATATITDAADNAAMLTHPAISLQVLHKVDAIKPTVNDDGVAMSSSAGNDKTYQTGETIEATVTFSEAVTVTGTPTLAFRIGTENKTALYMSGSGPTVLVFAYTVAEGDMDADGVSIGANQLAIQLDATIRDSVGNRATLTHAALPTQADHKVNTTPPPALAPDPPPDQDAPTVSSLAITSTSSGSYGIGDTIEITVTFSETVTVTGTPRLMLKLDSADQNAAYTRGSGTANLVFAHTVVTGDTDADGIEIEANKLSLNGGTIKDAANNDATLTHTALPVQTNHKVNTVPNQNLSQQGIAMAQAQQAPQGIATAQAQQVPISSRKMDEVSPSIAPNGVSISSTPLTHNTYKTGETIQATVTFTESVTVAGTPTLTLKVGTANKTAAYQSGSGAASLVFAYTVVAGDADTDGISIDANQLAGGIIKDSADNAATLTHAALPLQASHKVDAIAPTISSLVITSTAGTHNTYKTGERIQTTVTFSENVKVTGTPQLTLKIGSVYRNAAYAGGTDATDTLVFEYTVAIGDVDPDGISIDANQLAGTLTDIVGNAATLTHTALPTQYAHKVNVTTPPNSSGGSDPGLLGPTISSVFLNSTGPYGALDNIQVSVTATKSVTVTGSPTVTLVIGNTEKRANYQRGSGSSVLVFQYTVASGDGDDPNGVSLKANSLMGGAIKDAADNTLNPNHPALPDQGSHHRVDTTPPQVSSLAFTSTGPYGVGSTIQVTVTTSEPVTVTGNPFLTLVVGSTERTAGYLSGTETTSLVFLYTVTAADTDDTDGVSVKANALTHNGGTLVDATGNALNLSHSGIANGGDTQVVRITETADNALPLPHSGVTDGKDTQAVAITDPTDNAATLLHSGVANREDTQAAAITVSGISAVAFTSTGPYKVQDIVKIAVTAAEKVTVTGTPRISMTIGKETRYANYVSGNGTTTLVFQYTVVAGDADTDGIEIPQNALEHYNSSTIKMSGQTDLDLSHPSVAADARHIVKTPQSVSATSIPKGQTVPVNISEIMFTPGTSGQLPQWIELYNASKTDAVALQGWQLQVEIYNPTNPTTPRFLTLVIHKNLQILPKQTVLVVTKNGRNSQHFPEQRLYNLTAQHPEALEQFGPTADLLGDLGYAIVLRDAAGTQIDIVGNLDGDSSTNDRPSWKMYKGMSQNGNRTSIIRQYEKGTALDGTLKSNWFRATDTKRAVVSYYGHPRDIGYPGWRKGGPLPVQLSSFRAERTEQGAVIAWATASELENAGFNVLRSETRTGTFTIVTPRMLQGAGTTSERSTYEYVDTTAKENVAYYYRLEEVSFAGVRQPVATGRLRGHISAGNRYLTTFGSLKKSD